MPLDFPNTPVDGQIFNAAGVSWMWDGTKWTSVLSTGGPFLPLAGGDMSGPLNYVATGSTTKRSAQNRAADVANVLDFGADPTQATDSTAAFRAALATGRNVYVPRGRYQLRGQLIIGSTSTNVAQTLYGDGKYSQIWIGDNFDPTVTDGVFVLQGRETGGPGIRDLYIGFIQPNDLASRATMKTLAAGGTSFLGGTGVQYPPAVYFGLANRFRLERLKIVHAWDGFIQGNSPNSTGGWWMTDIEMGAYHVGLQIGRNKDFGRIARYHSGPFDCWPGQSNIMIDGNTYAWQFGVGAETEGISMVDVGVFCQRVQFNNNASWTHITNLQMDGDNCVIEHNDSQWTEISNVYFTCGQTGPSNGVPSIQMANGKLSVINISGWPGGLQPLINQGGGWLTVIGGSVYLPAVNNRLLTQSNGSCQISGVRFFPATGAGWTIAPAQCTGGTLSFTNNTVMAYTPASAGFLHINTDDAAHVVVANSWPTGSFTAPGALGTYNNASSLPLAGGSVSGMVTFGSWANFAQAAGTNRGMLFQTGGSMRWDLICNNDGEIGSNNGSNFQLDAYSDSGAFLATPIKVWRTNNVVELANLQVDGFIVGNIKLGTLVNAANDAAAATGGVGVQQVYRNGSVLMYRVS